MNGTNFIQPLESRTLFSATPVVDVQSPADFLAKQSLTGEYVNPGGSQSIDSIGLIGSATRQDKWLRAPQFREMASQID